MAGAGIFQLGMELIAHDLTKGAFRSAEANAGRYTRNTKNQFKSLGDKLLSYQKLVGSIVTAKVLSRGFAYLEQGIADVTSNIIDMDQALTSAAAKFGPEVGRGTNAFKEMDAVVKDIGATTEFQSSEIASGLDFLAMAGFDYQQSMKALRPLTDLATASQMDFARASDIASDALGAFNMSTAPDEIEGNLNRINDVFAKTVTTSNTTMETLFDTMKLAGPVVRDEAGKNEVMFAALAGTLGSAGIKGTIAATTLKNMFVRLQAPPAEARKALNKLNVEIENDVGGMRSMIDVIGDLNAAFAGKGDVARDKFLKALFGQRAIAGANVLLRKGKEELQDYYDLLDRSAGAASDMAEVMRGGLANQIKLLKSTLMARGMDIFQGLMGNKDPAEAVGELVDVLREFDVKPIVEGLREIGRFAKGTAQFLWENREAIISIAKIWTSVQLANKLTGFVGVLANVATSMGGVSSATSIATSTLGEYAKANGKVLTGLQAFGPVVASLVAGLATGYEIFKAFERQKERQQQELNKRIMGTFGKDVEGKRLKRKEAQEEFDKLTREWERDRKLRIMTDASVTAAGGKDPRTRDLELLTGDLSKSREVATIQEYARGLQQTLIEYGSEEAFRKYRHGERALRNRREIMESEEGDFYKGQGVDARITGTSEAGQSVMPVIQFNPEQKWQMNVQISNAPPGTTATASIEEVTSAPMDEQLLGVANG